MNTDSWCANFVRAIMYAMHKGFQIFLFSFFVFSLMGSVVTSLSPHMTVSPSALIEGFAFLGSQAIEGTARSIATSLDRTISDISSIASFWYPAGSTVADALSYGSTAAIAQEFDSIVAFGHVITDLSMNFFNSAQDAVLSGAGSTLGASSRALAVFDGSAGTSAYGAQASALQSASILDTFRSAVATFLTGLSDSIAPTKSSPTVPPSHLPALESPAVIVLPR